MQESSYHIEKQLHPIKVRCVRVHNVTRPTPYMARITFKGQDLHDFYSPGFDDHVKLLFAPRPGESLVVPQVGERGLVFEPGQPQPITRDYTPLAYNTETQELVIDFVLHGTGVASVWAERARQNDELYIVGPRGSMLIPTTFDWQILVGDETALPAITRRLSELAAGTKVTVLIAVKHAEARMPFITQANLDLHWIVEPEHEAMHAQLLSTLQSLVPTKQGEGFAWGAVEYALVNPIRELLLQQFDLSSARVKVSSYWRRNQ